MVGIKTQDVSALNDTPRFYQSETRPPALADFILWNPDINWSIRPLPPLPTSPQRIEAILEDLPLNSSTWWSKERCAYLLDQMSPKHRTLADQMVLGPEIRYGTVFRRVRNGNPVMVERFQELNHLLRPVSLVSYSRVVRNKADR